jgi:RNA polymerase sigma-70 factor (ECF subfamily)
MIGKSAAPGQEGGRQLDPSSTSAELGAGGPVARSSSVGVRPELAAIIRAHTPTLGRALRYLGVPASEIDDVLQEVFLVVHRRLGELDDPEGLGSWLRAVAVNVVRNRRRTARRRPLVYGEVPEMIDLEQSPEESLEQRRARADLLAALDELDDEQRMVLVMFEIEGASMREIAALAECSLATAYNRLGEARAALRKGLEAQERKRTKKKGPTP